jgi:NADPH2 dehydrogenase
MKNMRFKNFTFRNGKSTQNRVVVPPMASQTADKSGYATPQTIAHYERLSMSGAGLVIVEYSFIHSSGRGEENQLGIDTDNKVSGLSRIASAIQTSGSLAGIQIVHVGGKTTAALAGAIPLGASAKTVPVKGWQPDTPREASLEDIQNLTSWYLKAARRAAEAGFDFVELHAAHGYGLNQWLSPLTNHRGDEFGGSIDNRARLLLDVARKIKQKLPELLLAVRIPAQDHLPGGLVLSEMTWVAQQLQRAGVDLIDVSSGLGGWRRKDERTEQGYLVDDATSIRKAISVPVIGVGGILDGLTIDQFLIDGRVDFAAVGRAILREPQQWGEKHLIKDCFPREMVS